jgi:3-phenylpropionate/trans-cinnamate dioxygenase ferredoxin subunit
MAVPLFSEKIRWIKLAETESELLNQLADGRVRVLSAHGKHIGVLRVHDKIHAFRSICPHQGMSLEGGWHNSGQVVCPVHRYQFSLEHGRGAGLCLRIFRTESREDGFYAGIPYTAFTLFS